MIKLKDILYEIFNRYWTLESAKLIADKLNARIVGSVSLRGGSNHDLDLRIEHNDILSVTKILSEFGFSSYGSQLVSPTEAKKFKKLYGKGWQRAYNFINKSDKIIQIWMDEQ